MPAWLPASMVERMVIFSERICPVGPPALAADVWVCAMAGRESAADRRTRQRRRENRMRIAYTQAVFARNVDSARVGVVA
jgi:hypothetical protein